MLSLKLAGLSVDTDAHVRPPARGGGVPRSATRVTRYLQQPSTAEALAFDLPIAFEAAATPAMWDAHPWSSIPWGGQIDSTEFFTPDAGQEVEISFDGTVYFAGQILTVEHQEKLTISTGVRNLYMVRCVDWNWLFDSDSVLGVYPAGNSGDLVETLVAEFAPSGFTTNNVDTPGVAIPEQRFASVNLSTALNRIARLTGERWYIDSNKDVHWYEPPETGTTNPADIVSGSTNYRRLQWFPGDVAQVKTRVAVTGRRTRLASGVTSAATSLPLVDATDFDASGGDGIIGDPGVDAFSYTGKTGDTLTGVSGLDRDWAADEQVAVRVVVDDADAQAALAVATGTTGVRTWPITDHALSIDGCQARAEEELARYGLGAQRAQIEGWVDPDVDVGRILTVNLPERRIDNVDLLVQKIERVFPVPGRMEVDAELGPYRQDLIDLLGTLAAPIGREGSQ